MVRGRNIEDIISTLLTVGVFASVLLMFIGLTLYLRNSMNLELSLSDEWALSGAHIFDVFNSVLAKLVSMENLPYAFMALGVLMLMFTQYIRVLASVVYFSVIRDWKYVGITAFVLTILTLSLLGYIGC